MQQELPHKKTIVVDGVTTEYTLAGNSGPVVVLINGFRMPLSSWSRLYPEIQNHGRIFTYNRRGIGKTTKATRPQTGVEIIGTLEKNLNALNLFPPYILVAHSLGGLYANLYARAKPEHIAAVVFVEATHPNEKILQQEFKPPHLVRALTGALKAIDTFFDAYQHSEDECVYQTVQQIETAGSFLAIPVYVVSGGKKLPLVPEKSFAIHQQCQKALVKLSPHSKHITAGQSGHFPQITEPGIVNQAIKNIVEQVVTASSVCTK
jgi:pimeloyl-ACP methyl ester carboxylesterase